MGILTNALNQLTTSVIGLGVDQLDDWFTRMAERGLAKEAAMALDNHIAQQHDPYMNQATGQQALQNPMGGGVLPVVNGQATDFGNVQPIQPQSQLNMPQYSENYKAFLNPYTGQVMTYLANQEIQNDPRVAAAELAQKQQEAIINASGSAAGTLGGKGNIGNYDIGPYVMGTQSYSPQTIWGNAAQGAAQVDAAKFPEWQKRHDISVADQIRVKQTPGARAMGSGDGSAGEPGAGMPTPALNQVDKILAQEGEKYGQASYDSLMGNLRFQPNEGGVWIKQRANDIYAAQGKKKNFLKAVNQAKSEWDAQAKQQGQQEEERIKGLGRLGVNAPVTQQPMAIQNLPTAQPGGPPKTTPLPTALPNVAPTPTGPTTPAPATPVTAMQMINAISKAKAAGESSAYIRDMIKSKGFDPGDFGY